MSSGAPAALFSSASNEWYTPAVYVEAARRTLGGIDLDPASCPTANATVRAGQIYTEADDGLSRPWFGRIWLNPPYGVERGESRAGVWGAKLIAEFRAGRVSAGVLLVNAVTDRKWFRPFWEFPICLTDHRIKFVGGAAGRDSPVCGSAFVLVGGDVERFAFEFRDLGRVTLALQKRYRGCAVCGVPMIGKRSHAATCSVRCRVRSHRAQLT